MTVGGKAAVPGASGPPQFHELALSSMKTDLTWLGGSVALRYTESSGDTSSDNSTNKKRKKARKRDEMTCTTCDQGAENQGLRRRLWGNGAQKVRGVWGDGEFWKCMSQGCMSGNA